MGYVTTIVACGAVLATLVHTHETFWGKCPKVKAMEDFEIQKFAGLWYVIELFEKNVQCMKWNITRSPDGKEWWINEQRGSGVLNAVGIQGGDLTTGTLSISNQRNPGAMVVKWPLNIAGRYDFTVFDTDYKRYAGVFQCQNIAFFQRQQPLILSRTPVLDNGLSQTAAGKLSKYGIEMTYFQKVEQIDCARNSETTATATTTGNNIKEEANTNFETDNIEVAAEILMS